MNNEEKELKKAQAGQELSVTIEQADEDRQKAVKQLEVTE